MSVRSAASAVCLSFAAWSGLVGAQPQTTSTSAAQRITPDGLQCGTHSFDVLALGPSFRGANLFRAARIIDFGSRALRLSGDTSMPGYRSVVDWSNAQHTPWTPLPPVASLGQNVEIWNRVERMSQDDRMEAESIRALAHQACLLEMGDLKNVKPQSLHHSLSWPTPTGQLPQHYHECAALVDAEEALDPSLAPEFKLATRLPDKPGTATKNVIVTFTPRTDADVDVTVAYEVTPHTAAGQSRTANDSQSAVVAALVAQSESLVKEGSGAKVTLDAATYQERAKVAYFYLQLWCSQNGSPGAVCSKSAGEGLVALPTRTAWSAATPQLVQAARKIPLRRIDTSNWDSVLIDNLPELKEIVVGHYPHPEGRELACQRAEFYVSATHDLVDRTLPFKLTEPSKRTLSICIDTESFAVDKPVQVLLSTQQKSRVEVLWPGEPQEVDLTDLQGNKPEVLHITVGGYPRRDLLRALARNPGGPLEKTDIFQYIEEAQKANEQATQANSSEEFKTFAKGLAGNEPVVQSIQDLGDALAVPIKTDLAAWRKNVRDKAATALEKLLAEAKKASPSVETAFEKLLPTQPDLKLAVSPSDLSAAAQKIVQIFAAMNASTTPAPTPAPASPSSPPPAAPGSAALANPPPAPTPAAPASDKHDAALAAIELCQLTSTLVPLVTNDVLLLPEQPSKNNRGPYVLTYDFKGGFEGAEDWPMNEKQPLFAVVHNVEPGWSIGVSINNKAIVQRKVSLVGMPTPTGPADAFNNGTSQASLGFDHINPLAIEMQPPSTQILSLGNLGGGARYDLVVCASNQLYDDCSQSAVPPSSASSTETSGAAATRGASSPADTAPKTADAAPAPMAQLSHRTISKNSIMVHATHFLGVRAGLGIDVSWASENDLVSLPGLNGQVVRQQVSPQADASLPLLLAVYPGTVTKSGWENGRDSTEMPRGLGFGVVGGLDLLQVSATPRFYLGGVFDLWGFGITVTSSLERYGSVSIPSGSFVATGTNAQVDYAMKPGLLVALTTDADIFQAIFQNYFQTAQFPSISPPGGH